MRPQHHDIESVGALSGSERHIVAPAPAPRSRRFSIWPQHPRDLRVSAATPGEQAAFQILASLSIITVLAMALALSPRFMFPLDDAYITIHNAQSLLGGRDPNYLGVNPLVGATSLVHLALVTALCLVGSPILASYGAGCLGVIAYTTALAAMAFGHGGSRLTAAMLVGLGLFTGFMPVQLVNGLESGLALAGIAWAIVLADRPKPSRALALLCGTLAFVRPELGALSGLLMARQIWMRWHGSGTEERPIRDIVVDLALALAAAAPWMIWSYVETAAILPNTANAKVAFFAENQIPFPDRIREISSALWLAGLLPVLLTLALARSDLLTNALRAFGLIVLGLFAWKFPGGLFHNIFRYTYVLLPVGLYGLLRIVQDGPAALRRLVVATSILAAALSLLKIPATEAGITTQTSELPIVAAWAGANLPPDATVLVHDAGFIAYATALHLVDVVGLKTPDATAVHRALTEPSGGAARAQAINLIAFRHGVTHAIILHDRNGFWNGIADDLRREGWRLDPLFGSDRPDAYEVYRLAPPASPVVGGLRPGL